MRFLLLLLCCISVNFVNGDSDCYHTRRKGNWKLCRESLKYVTNSQICDGKPDCPLKDDEFSCNSTCSEDKWFSCGINSKQCIEKHAVCNGFIDCANNADEKDCDYSYSMKKQSFVSVLEKPKHSIRQITCLNTADCECPPGYQRKFIERRAKNYLLICKEVDVCKQITYSQQCSHMCTYSAGRHQCLCYDNYEIDISNPSSCIEIESDPTIFSTYNSQIGVYDYKHNKFKPFTVFYQQKKIQGRNLIALEAYRNDSVYTVFWADHIEQAIMWAKITDLKQKRITADKLFFKENLEVNQLSYDSIHNNLYYFEKLELKLCILSLEYTKTTCLQTGADLSGLRVSYYFKKLFWIEYSRNKTGMGRIVSTDLDGSNKILLTKERYAPSGLIVDEVTRSMYWLENFGAVLLTKHLNEQDHKIKMVFRGNFLIDHLYISSSPGFIIKKRYYFVAINNKSFGYSKSLFSCEDGSHNQSGYHFTSLKVPIQITATMDKLRKLDQCSSNPCPYMCLNSDDINRFTCHCPDGMIKTKHNLCLSDRRPPTNSMRMIQSKTKMSNLMLGTLICLIVMLLALAVVLTSFVNCQSLYKSKSKGKHVVLNDACTNDCDQANENDENTCDI